MSEARSNNEQAAFSIQLQGFHVPVLLAEVMSGIAPQPGGRYIDGTLGGGGHAAAMLAASTPDGQLLGIDTDPAALATARERLAPFGTRARLIHGNFRDLAQIAQ